MTVAEPTLAANLILADKLGVIECLVYDVVLSVQTVVSTSRPASTQLIHRALWAQLQESMYSLPSPRTTLADQLEQDRADRDRALQGG